MKPFLKDLKFAGCAFFVGNCCLFIYFTDLIVRGKNSNRFLLAPNLFQRPASHLEVTYFRNNFSFADKHNRNAELFEKFKEICEEANATWSLSWGSLLGSYRHHDMEPWGYENDVFMARKDKEAFIRILDRQKNPNLVLEEYENFASLYFNNGVKFPKTHTPLPRIDIEFWLENSTHI